MTLTEKYVALRYRAFQALFFRNVGPRRDQIDITRVTLEDVYRFVGFETTRTWKTKPPPVLGNLCLMGFAQSIHVLTSHFPRRDGSRVEPWKTLSDEQCCRAVLALAFVTSMGLEFGPEALTLEFAHWVWRAGMLADGWSEGPVFDPTLKLHPDLAPAATLSTTDRVKDHIWMSFAKMIIES